MAKQEIVEAIVKSNIGEVADGLDKAKKSAEGLADSTKKADKGFGRVGNAVRGIGTALKAAGIGLVVALFVKLADTFRQNQKVVDTFNTAMKFLSIVFNDFFKFLENNIDTASGFMDKIFGNKTVQSVLKFGKILGLEVITRIKNLIQGIGGLGKALTLVFEGQFEEATKVAGEAVQNLTDYVIGNKEETAKMEEQITKVTNKIKEYTQSTLESAGALVELDKQAEISAALNQQIIEQKDREAELQRQIRDDETRTMEDRMKASAQLKTILDEQEKAMLANAEAVTKAAQAQYNLTKNDADYLLLIQAQTEESAVLAQIEGFRSEQKSQDIALTREQTETLKEQKQVALDNAQAQLEAYGQLAGALSGLAGENKALAVAGAIIDTYAGANKAFATGGPAGFVTGAAIIASGLANVRKIMEQD